jgi:hypothetical protein
MAAGDLWHGCSSVIERAGGFQSDAYPYGAVLQRTQLRELEARAQDEMILRVKDAQTTLELRRYMRWLQAIHGMVAGDRCQRETQMSHYQC